MKIEELMQIHLQFKVRGSMRYLHPTTMPLWSLMQGIQENKKLADLTAEGRAIEDKDVLAKWKPHNLMSVYLGVRFKNTEDGLRRANAEQICEYTGLAGFDFDNVDPQKTLRLLRDVPHVICAAVSISGCGVWCVAPVAASSHKEFILCFAEAAETFKSAGIYGQDLGAFDPTRARFIAFSPEAWWRWDAEGDIPSFMPCGDILKLHTTKKQRKSLKLPKGYKISPELAFDEVRRELETIDTIPDGERNNEKARMCGKLKLVAKKAGVSPAAYYQPFIDAWDKVGSTHNKTVSIANRLLLGGEK